MDIAASHPPTAAIRARHSSSPVAFLAHPLWVGAGISFLAGFVLGLLVFLVWRRAIRRFFVKLPDPSKEASTNPTLFTPIIRSLHDLFFLYNDIDDGDSPSRPPLEVIGRGACGEVYRADLLTGGQTITVAIKKILQPSLIDAPDICDQESKALDHRMRQIKSEIVTVGRMRHPHLVRLLAHVPRPHCHYLVYEYMTNGSLHDVLKADEATRRLKLHWPNRLHIAQGIAAGLEYLHMVHRPRIIHRDLKPANILLDHDLTARIADFGLAKVVPEAVSGAVSSAHVAGTLGYIAPEYYRTLSCTDKSDVYSFGVILAVLVTGMFPSDVFFHTADESSLVGWVRRMAMAPHPIEGIDSLLLGSGYDAEIVLVLKIACFCTYDDPTARPNSREVRRMLSEIKQ